MDEDKLRNQIPIFRFFNKHKWRIILPIVFCLGYYGLPIYFMKKPAAIQSHLFVTSTQNSTPEQLNQEVTELANAILSDESILGLIAKYDLFADARKKGVPHNALIDMVRTRAIVVEPEINNPPEGVIVYVWANFWADDSKNTAFVSDEIASRFESHPNFGVLRTVDLPSDISSRGQGWILIIPAFQGAFCSLLLIFIWEMPFLFYSRKTQEMVFDPIRSDWQDERIEAKIHGDFGDVFIINIRYSFAFVGAMLAKSPVGELFEFVGKFAR